MVVECCEQLGAQEQHEQYSQTTAHAQQPQEAPL
jgi:hypothetical protein